MFDQEMMHKALDSFCKNMELQTRNLKAISGFIPPKAVSLRQVRIKDSLHWICYGSCRIMIQGDSSESESNHSSPIKANR